MQPYNFQSSDGTVADPRTRDRILEKDHQPFQLIAPHQQNMPERSRSHSAEQTYHFTGIVPSPESPRENAVEQQKDKVANTTPVSPPKPPKINLKDQEVPNPHYDKVVNELGGIPLGDNESDDDEWTGNEIIKFGKYRDVAWKDCLDENYIGWLANSSKVDWQRELALKEIKRRSK